MSDGRAVYIYVLELALVNRTQGRISYSQISVDLFKMLLDTRLCLGAACLTLLLWGLRWV